MINYKLKVFGTLSFSNCKILKIFCFSKLKDFKNLMIFGNGKFLEFSKLKSFEISELKFLEYLKFQILSTEIF